MITALTKVKPLRYWVQKVLPLVYDDSLSYYELLNKAIYKLNELIEANNGLPEAIEAEIENQLTTAIPNGVAKYIAELMSDGSFNKLIIDATRLESQQYLGNIFDTSFIEYLETVDGDPIMTASGEYIFVSVGEKTNPYTTNESSYFYKYLHDASNKILEGKKPINTSSFGYLAQPPVLTLLHYSDYHGDDDELNYIYYNWGRVLDLCDDYICTGDMIRERFSDSFEYFANTSDLHAKQTMLVIGNHDALAAQTGFDWNDVATQREEYDKFLAPTIGYWNVVYTEGLTYYYKDYESQNIRLIVLNDMLKDADMIAQLNWLETVALNTDKYVVIAKHYLPPTPVRIDSTFTAIDYNPSGYGDSLIPQVVNSFITNGGKFICYMVGHQHYDFVARLSEYPNQLCICVDAASREQCNQWSDVMRYDNEISRDLFNIVQFDTSTQTIKIIRCGCNYDRYLRHKDTLSLNWNNGTVIYN